MSLRHERRRRLLADELLSEQPQDDDAPIRNAIADEHGVENKQRAYTDAARDTRKRPIQDFFPSRYLTISLTTAAGLTLVALVQLLHVWAGSLARVLSAEEIVALDLNGLRNISHWFASTWLGVSSLVAIFIYSLRRHRVDDYHGRYRVWIWTALCCLLASLGETTDMAALGQGLGRRAASFCGLSEPAAWPTLLVVVLVIMGFRLVLEIRHCRLAMITFLLSAACLALTVGVDHDWLGQLSDDNKLLAGRGCRLIGYVFILTSFLLYARQVVLEIEGLIAVVPHKPKAKKVKAAPRARPDAISIDPPQRPAPHVRTDLDPVEDPSDSSAASRLQIGGASSGISGSSPAADLSETSGGLSRAERRRRGREAKLAS